MTKSDLRQLRALAERELGAKPTDSDEKIVAMLTDAKIIDSDPPGGVASEDHP